MTELSQSDKKAFRDMNNDLYPITVEERIQIMMDRIGPNASPELRAQVIKEQSKAAYRKRS